jgi:hypothetical protein
MQEPRSDEEAFQRGQGFAEYLPNVLADGAKFGTLHNPVKSTARALREWESRKMRLPPPDYEAFTQKWTGRILLQASASSLLNGGTVAESDSYGRELA